MKSSILVLAVAAAASAAPMFRSLDGIGNNAVDPNRGSAMGAFLRQPEGVAFYADGASAIDNETLPNARLVSNSIFGRKPVDYNRKGVSLLMAAWGQFIAHDTTMTGAHNESDPSEVVQVEMPAGEAFFDGPINFARNFFDPTTGTSAGNPRTLLNAVTSFIDASTVYGCDATRLAQIRTGSRGLLRTDPVNGVPPNTMGLDMAAGIYEVRDQRVGGDKRVGENPGLLSLHGLFNLEHNRWARHLAEEHSTWNDERLFQEARKRVMAIMQSIAFNEYAPILLGRPLPAYNGYQSTINPATDLAFGLAAYRYGHSGINGMYWCVTAEGRPCEAGPLLLRDSFFNPTYLQHMSIADILRGLVVQPEGEIDTSMPDDVRQWLMGIQGDLAAIDIMRGRDGGLPSLAQARGLYGLPAPRTFADITPDTWLQAKLEELYGSVDNVDLWVGGLAEEAEGSAFVGPTFAAIIQDQFVRLRDGDRWYYGNTALGSYENGAFVPYLTAEERAEIAATRIGHVIRRNTDFTNAPDSCFRTPQGTSLFESS